MQQSLYHEMSALENKHWWFTARRKYLQKVITTYFKNKNALHFYEIGCGTGGNLSLLAKFARVDAVEMNDTARQLVMDKKINNVVNDLPNHVPQEKQYDGVFSLDVIEHVEDDLAALKKLKTCINKDGLLITTVPAYQWLWSKHDVANHHFRRYTKDRYCQLIQSAGYEINYASYFNTLLFPLAVLSRLAEYFIDKFSGSNNATLSMPSKFINQLFSGIFNLESHWATKITMPFGLSIIVVAKCKPE